MLNCQFCSKECVNQNSHRNHERCCPSNPNRNYKNGMLGKKGRNQHIKAKDLGLSKPELSAESRLKISEKAKGRKKSAETLEKLSIAAKRNNLGGHTSKQKLFFKKNDGEIVYLQSSYEIRFAQILEELGVHWSRPAPLIWIDDVGISHKYYPDFLVDDKFFDTKNDFLIKKDARKVELVIQQNSINLIIVCDKMINKEEVKSLL